MSFYLTADRTELDAVPDKDKASLNEDVSKFRDHEANLLFRLHTYFDDNFDAKVTALIPEPGMFGDAQADDPWFGGPSEQRFYSKFTFSGFTSATPEKYIFGQRHEIELDNAASYNAWEVFGDYFSVNMLETNAANYDAVTGYRNIVNLAAEGFSYFARGGRFEISQSGGFEASVLEGVSSNVVLANDALHNLSSMTGYTSEVWHFKAGRTVTNAYGFYFSFLNSGIVTNTYGYYCGDVTAGTQTNRPYAFYAVNGRSRLTDLTVESEPSIGAVTLTVKGSAAQAANLQEWQTSAAAVLAKMDITGWLTATRVQAPRLSGYTAGQLDMYGANFENRNPKSQHRLYSESTNAQPCGLYTNTGVRTGSTGTHYGVWNYMEVEDDVSFANTNLVGNANSLWYQGGGVLSGYTAAVTGWNLYSTPTDSPAAIIYGGDFEALVIDAATVAGARAGYFLAGVEGGGAVAEITGVYVEPYTTGASSSATNVYGVYIKDLFNTGTIANYYGVYVGDITQGTQTNPGWSFFASDANGRSRFAGRNFIGAPASAPDDAHLSNNEISLYMNGNDLMARIRKSDGTYVTANLGTGS